MTTVIGQNIADPWAGPETRAELAEGQRRRYAQGWEARKRAALPAADRCIRLMREAEGERESIRWELGKAAAAVLLGEADEAAVLELERELADAETRIRRWKLAHGELDRVRGVVRDSEGNDLSIRRG